MDRYVKFCKSGHNILRGCTTLQVGTLEYYRTMENKKGSIGDPNEGLERTIIQSYDSTITDKRTRDQLVAIHADDTSRVVVNCSIQEDICPNCYVYCLTRIGENDGIPNGKEYDECYDSYFVINDIRAFAAELRKLTMQTSTLDVFSNTEMINRLSTPEIKQIRLEYVHKLVTYVDSRSAVIDESRITRRPRLENRYDRILFTKENKHKSQNEYGIVFAFVHPKHGILPVKKAPLIIDISLSPIRRYPSNQ